jgi:hypothetical protein
MELRSSTLCWAGVSVAGETAAHREACIVRAMPNRSTL